MTFSAPGQQGQDAGAPSVADRPHIVKKDLGLRLRSSLQRACDDGRLETALRRHIEAAASEMEPMTPTKEKVAGANPGLATGTTMVPGTGEKDLADLDGLVPTPRALDVSGAAAASPVEPASPMSSTVYRPMLASTSHLNGSSSRADSAPEPELAVCLQAVRGAAEPPPAQHREVGTRCLANPPTTTQAVRPQESVVLSRDVSRGHRLCPMGGASRTPSTAGGHQMSRFASRRSIDEEEEGCFTETNSLQHAQWSVNTLGALATETESNTDVEGKKLRPSMIARAFGVTTPGVPRSAIAMLVPRGQDHPLSRTRHGEAIPKVHSLPKYVGPPPPPMPSELISREPSEYSLGLRNRPSVPATGLHYARSTAGSSADNSRAGSAAKKYRSQVPALDMSKVEKDDEDGDDEVIYPNQHKFVIGEHALVASQSVPSLNFGCLESSGSACDADLGHLRKESRTSSLAMPRGKRSSWSGSFGSFRPASQREESSGEPSEPRPPRTAGSVGSRSSQREARGVAAPAPEEDGEDAAEAKPRPPADDMKGVAGPGQRRKGPVKLPKLQSREKLAAHLQPVLSVNEHEHIHYHYHMMVDPKSKMKKSGRPR